MISQSQNNNDRLRPEIRIRAIKAGEYSAAADCAIDSYARDPLSLYLVTGDPDGQVSTKAEKKLERYMYESMLTSFVVGDGMVEVVEETDSLGVFRGLAAWARPGGTTTDYFTEFRSGLWRLSWYMDRAAKVRFYDEFLKGVEGTYEDIMKNCPRYWYLAYLGVRSTSQGKGYGRVLLENVIERADKEGIPCYLESSTDKNIQIYEKFGFKLARTIYIGSGIRKVPIPIMIRPGKNSASNTYSY